MNYKPIESMKYTCLIVDAAPQNIPVIYKELVANSPEIEVLGEYSDIAEALSQIHDLRPDMVFIDTDMVEQVHENLLRILTQKTYLIFTSEWIENSVKAFVYNGLDFLLKPILKQELSRVVKKILWKENQLLRQQIEELKGSSKVNMMERKVAIPSNDGIHLFPIGSIIRLKAERNYTRIHFANQESMLTSKTLKSYEQILPRKMFQRVHQSHVLNLSKIKSYINRDGGYLLMEDGSTITVSTRKKHELLEYLKGR